ncbi:hypothetical protein AYI68_g3414 [Smittium mucronatum]|uniref:Uncharacterized protein n=1 Tax=Smittium mucronatum TaxID=133383 RepID=A0A1R0H033_9FUNG|nr:hypothetical protein AYI68_g3414 [Smittium mucronatum]
MKPFRFNRTEIHPSVYNTDVVFPLQMKIKNLCVRLIKSVFSFRRAFQLFIKQEFVHKFSTFDGANESQELRFITYIARFVELMKPQQHRFVFKRLKIITTFFLQI